MRGPRTDALRRSLQISIDASGPYQTMHPSVSDTSISPISSARASIATSNMTWSTETDESVAGDSRLCSVLCLYDFTSDDPDHLTFRAQELLDVVRQEDTGWWAALRRDGGLRVGWVPSAFVQVLSDEMADRLWRERDQMRVWRPEDDELLEDGSIPRFADGSRRVPEWSQSDDELVRSCSLRHPGVCAYGHSGPHHDGDWHGPKAPRELGPTIHRQPTTVHGGSHIPNAHARYQAYATTIPAYTRRPGAGAPTARHRAALRKQAHAAHAVYIRFPA